MKESICLEFCFFFSLTFTIQINAQVSTCPSSLLNYCCDNVMHSMFEFLYNITGLLRSATPSSKTHPKGGKLGRDRTEVDSEPPHNDIEIKPRWAIGSLVLGNLFTKLRR